MGCSNTRTTRDRPSGKIARCRRYCSRGITAQVAHWRRQQRLRRTLERRPDLPRTGRLTPAGSGVFALAWLAQCSAVQLAPADDRIPPSQ